MPKELLGQELKRLRLHRGRTMAHMAEDFLGSPKKARRWSKLERNEISPDPDLRRRIEEWAGLQAGALDAFDDSPPPSDGEVPRLNAFVGSRIAEIQERSGMTQIEASVEVFGSEKYQGHLSRWRAGVIVPQLESLIAIAEWGDVSLAYFNPDDPITEQIDAAIDALEEGDAAGALSVLQDARRRV